jgi:NADPH:quinone reductase-like Zn-dependent oxidoreductase
MKAYEISDAKGIDNLKMVERATPKPGHGQVLVLVRSTSLNYRDLVTVKGTLPRSIKRPLIPLSDGAGEVVEVGPGVTSVKVGDRVAGIFMQTWLAGPPLSSYGRSALGGALDGMLAEHVVLDEDGVVHIPAYMTYDEAASLPCAAVTSWNALVTEGHVKSGNTVLVMGTGGVSIFALQFARMHGARVIATSSSDEKLKRLTKMGAAGVINYKTTANWEDRVLELTDGEGVDHVVEVGGAGTLAKSFKAVKTGGRISLIGLLSGASEVNPTPILLKGACIQGIFVGSREMFEEMNRALAMNDIHPVIDKVFPFEQAREAWRYLESGAHFGKVCIAV